MKKDNRHKSEKKHNRTSPVRSQPWHIALCVLLLILVVVVYQVTKFDRVVPNSTLGVMVTTEPSVTEEPSEETEETTEPTTEATQPVTEATQPTASTDPNAEPTDPTAEAPVGDNSVALARALMDYMTMEEKLMQLFIVSPESLTDTDLVTNAGEKLQAGLKKSPVGGVCYATQNILSDDQLRDMIASSQMWNKFPMFTVVNREGESSERLKIIGVGGHLGDQASMATQDSATLFAMGQELGADMLRIGLNLDLGPVADVRTAPNDLIGSRSFGADSAAVSDRVNALVGGVIKGGAVPCMKYFPGYGSTSGEIVDRTLDELRQVEFPVFTNGVHAGAGMIMASHLVLAEADNVPSDLSPKVITDILRGELGYKGVVITEEQNRPAITEHYTSGQAALLAIQAGCDLILMPNDFQSAYDTLLRAANDGSLPEARINESVLRILTLKYRSGIILE